MNTRLQVRWLAAIPHNSYVENENIFIINRWSIPFQNA
jgi:hypothetical protein